MRTGVGECAPCPTGVPFVQSAHRGGLGPGARSLDPAPKFTAPASSRTAPAQRTKAFSTWSSP